jgi:hypothetical protein
LALTFLHTLVYKGWEGSDTIWGTVRYTNVVGKRADSIHRIHSSVGKGKLQLWLQKVG